MSINKLIKVVRHQYKPADRSSAGLLELLERQGVEPTGHVIDDLALAREFMPMNYKQYLEILKNE